MIISAGMTYVFVQKQTVLIIAANIVKTQLTRILRKSDVIADTTVVVDAV
jgi:hypothetical protein